LWLLRGIARRCCGDYQARVDLQRAALFLQGLQVHEDSVSSLLTLGATRLQAIAALRRSGGNADVAAEALLTDAARKRQQRLDRKEQQKFGQTAKGDFVDLECVAQLSSMGVEQTLAVAALKKSNNDICGAMDFLQSMSAGEALGDSKRQRLEPTGEAPVDDLALATIISLGFDEESACEALRGSAGSIDDALIALTAKQKPGHGVEAGGVTELGPTTSEVGSTEVTEVELPVAPDAVVHEGAQGKDAKHTEIKAQEEAKRRQALDHARNVVEKALGGCLRKTDLDDEVAGAELEEEEALLQQHLSAMA